jgi:hypothetical protein
MPGYINAVNSKSFHDLRFHVQGFCFHNFFLIAIDKILYGHKIIVSCRCPQLAKQIPFDKKDVYLNDVEYAPFLAYLHYLYTDTIKCESTLIPKL